MTEARIWTDEELGTAAKMRLEGQDILTIAARIGRSVHQTRYKLTLMGVNLGPKHRAKMNRLNGARSRITDRDEDRDSGPINSRAELMAEREGRDATVRFAAHFRAIAKKRGWAKRNDKGQLIDNAGNPIQ